MLNRQEMYRKLEEARSMNPEPKACRACYVLDRKRSGNEFQMYRCQECLRAINVARLNLWRAFWKIYNSHLKGLNLNVRIEHQEATWLKQQMASLEKEAKALKAEAV